MKLFAVTGNPILHSKSPQIYNDWFKRTHFPAHYFRLAADSSLEAIQLYEEIGLSGLNVTAPFKNSICNNLDSIDESAKIIDGCNTVYSIDNKLIGTNTDYYGVLQTLQNSGIELNGLKCLIIGTSGAGAAAAYGLKKYGAEVTLCNRTQEKAENLANKLNCWFVDFSNLRLEISVNALIINTLPSDVKIIKSEWINSHHIIFDANYKNSYLEAICSNKGIQFINGEKWLINQAVPAFKLYTGLEATQNNLELKSKFTSKPVNITLIGFMATGKSTVAHFLAKLFGYQYVDLDEKIENREKSSISSIFEQNGETYFREQEKNMLKEVMLESNQIISCGGGIVLDENNRKLLSNNSLVVWLWADYETILSRVNDDKRPLLNSLDRRKTIENLLNQRKSLYALACDILINTDGRTPDEIAQKIYEEINQAFSS
jgi:shikimate dehydrogenase